ncbi:uncharacterized protein LOC127730538 [Mytilus californianus]|uniref:uncharacterized protein LOC127730538 n=1 Tax=Mytilus californianus TaxID=6549 RepID=UPI0022486094|nr:uncharacterized protein LOC127730538 [Mytilus californianus]
MKYTYLFAIVHLVISRSTNDVHTNLDKMNDVCEFTVSKSSKENFKTEWINSDSLIAKFTFEIYDRNMKPMKYSKSNETFLPLEWSVTLGHEAKGNLYTSWMIDNWLYSFGLLDARTLTDITIQLLSTSPSCQIKFGENETVQSITTALHTLSVKTWREHDKKMKNIRTYWCFYSAYPRITDSAWYTAKIYFGFAIRMFGYRCCYKTRTELFECTDENDSRLNQYQLMPYYVGMVFFCFFPIMLMKCSARSMKSGSKIRTAKQKSYQSFDFDDKYIYLQKRSPVSVASLFLGICGLGFKHPVAATRIRRIVFVLGLPLFVYLEILMYYIGWPELAPALVKNKIPFGFSSILGGLSESRSLFLPMFGGPFIALFLYFVAGIVLLVIPVDHGSHIEMGLPSDNGEYSSLLSMNVATIEKLSSKCCLNRTGYHKIYCVLRSNVFMLINPKFWSFVIGYQIMRYQRSLSFFNDQCNFPIVVLPICIFLLPLYILLCFIELCLVIIYYGLPMISFLFICVRGYTLSLHRYFTQKHCVLTAIFMFITTILYLYFLFMCCIIILASFTFLTCIVFFVYLSVVIFPNYSFTFVYSFFMLLFFVYRIGSEIEHDYFELLLKTIKAVKYIGETREDVNYVVTEPGTELVNIEMLSTDNEGRRVRERRQLPGIPKKLFEFVTRKHRPLHICIFLSVLQIALMSFLISASIVFVSQYVRPMRTDESSEILHVLSVLLITILPNLIHSFFTEKINPKVRKLKIRQTVIEFYQLEL